MPHSTFSDRVYWLVAQVPPGHVVTYGQIATLAGSAGAARAVGNLMRNVKKNTAHQTALIPWQRVINAQGKIPSKGDTVRAELQRHLLEREGIHFSPADTCDLAKYAWTFEWIPWH